MRIALFSDTYEPEINGVASSVLTLEKILIKHGHEVYVVTTNNGIHRTKWEGNVLRLPGIELKALYGYVASSPLSLRAVDYIKHLNLDIIHVHTEFGIGILGRYCAKKLSIPLVATFHTTYEDYTHYVNLYNLNSIENMTKKTIGAIRKYYANSSMLVISPSNKTRHLIEGYDIKTEIEVIPTGLNLEQFSKNSVSKDRVKEIRNECGLKDDEIAIAYVGRLAKEKSVDVIIKAFSKIKANNLRLIIVGDGPEANNLKTLMSTLGLDNKVKFIGNRPRTHIHEYYCSFNAFCSASLSETQGLTFIEALACELPIFVADKETTKDLVENRKNGYIFTCEDDLALVLDEFSKIDISEMKKYTTEKVKPYDLEYFYNSIINVYTNSINKYQNYYEIDNINIKGDIVSISIIDNKKINKYYVTDEVFMEYALRKKEKISDKLYSIIQKENDFIVNYQKSIRYISYKDRTIKEMYDYLTKNTDLDIANINNIIEKLELKGYLNDEKYAINYVSSALRSLKGKKSIIYSLRKLGVDTIYIENAINLDENEDELTYAIKYANKQLNSNTKSKKYFIESLKNKLYSRGYNKEIIEKTINNLNFYDLDNNEIELLKDECYKLLKKNSKLKGTKLRNHVFRSLINKGFDYKDIYIVMNEME